MWVFFNDKFKRIRPKKLQRHCKLIELLSAKKAMLRFCLTMYVTCKIHSAALAICPYPCKGRLNSESALGKAPLVDLSSSYVKN